MDDLFRNHARLLRDRVRMEAYQRAIAKAVKPGMAVVDLGCGFGALSHMAIDYGARVVYAIEADGATLAWARIAAENYYSTRSPTSLMIKKGTNDGKNKPIKFLQGLSYSVRLPEKVDVVISETLGNLGINENIVAALFDAKKRFLKKNGIIIPEAIKVWVVPVENKAWANEAEELRRFLPDDPRLELGISSEDIESGIFLADPRQIFDINIHKLTDDGAITTTATKTHFKIGRKGVLSGFAGWFEVHLIEDIKFSTAPDAEQTHWKQAFLPLRRSEKIQCGETIEFSLFIEQRGLKNTIGYDYRISKSR